MSELDDLRLIRDNLVKKNIEVKDKKIIALQENIDTQKTIIDLQDEIIERLKKQLTMLGYDVDVY